MNNKYIEEILKFLKETKLLAIATKDDNGNPWIANVFFGVDDDLNIYFESKRDTRHSKNIENNGYVAYTVATFNPKNEEDKISIQATGNCELVKDLKTLAIGAKVIFSKFADWQIDPVEALKQITQSGMYVIRPKYIKFWHDRLLGDKQEEITF